MIRAICRCFKTLIGIAAWFQIERMLGRAHWYGIEIDQNTGRESLYSVIRRRQDELRGYRE